MAEPTIYAQANRYLAGELSHENLHNWVFDRLGYYLRPDLDGTPDSDLASLLVGLFCDCDLQIEILGGYDEEEFRQSLAEFIAKVEPQLSHALR